MQFFFAPGDRGVVKIHATQTNPPQETFCIANNFAWSTNAQSFLKHFRGPEQTDALVPIREGDAQDIVCAECTSNSSVAAETSCHLRRCLPGDPHPVSAGY